MSSHTSGPWEDDAENGFVTDERGDIVCQTWNKMEEDFANASANRTLIAAAPDLLEACRAARRFWLAAEFGDDHVILHQLGEAIAKAEGSRPAPHPGSKHEG